MADAAQDASLGEDPKLRIMRVIATYTACIYSLLVYDYLISLPKEYRLIWRAKPSLVSALYIIVRYWSLAKYAFSLYLSNTVMSWSRCAKYSTFQVYSILPLFICIGTLLILRIYALWERSKIILVSLSTFLLASVVVICVAGRSFSAPRFRGGADGPCFAGPKPDATRITMTLWLLPFLLDVVCTTLLVTRVVLFRKRGSGSSGLLRVLMRDGLVYFAIISAVNIINLIFYNLPPSTGIQSVNSAMSYMISSIASCRLILSLREHALQDGISHATSTFSNGGNGDRKTLTKSAAFAQTGTGGNGGTGFARVRDPESGLEYPTLAFRPDAHGAHHESHQMTPVPVHAISVGIEKRVVISDDHSDKEYDEKDATRVRAGSRSGDAY